MRTRRNAKTPRTVWPHLHVVSFGLIFVACATAPKPPKPSAPAAGDLPIPAQWRAEIRKAEGLGFEIYLLDKVSAIGTDELMKNVPSYREKNLGGYLSFREAADALHVKDSFLVTFFTKNEPPQIAYEFRIPFKVDAKPDFKAFEPPKAANDSFVTFVRARKAAVAALPPTRQPINPVILPGAANDEKGILVYLLAGTTEPNVAVFGRHFRVLMPEHGTTPTYVMPLSKSALEIPMKGPPGAKSEGLMVTHLLTDWPLETHVFASLLYRIPVYVATAAGLWRVDAGKIAFIERRPSRSSE